MSAQRWRVVLEYDGAGWAGWQLQDNVPTLQGAVEGAVHKLFGHPARVSAAGRTDAGVHAAMQVVSFVSATPREPRAVRDGLCAHLPPSIACLAAERVAEDFDPRRAPHRKTYRYTWLVRPSRSPLRAGRVVHVRRGLDVAAMAAGAAHLVGTHDFSSFRAAGCTANTTVRTIADAGVVAEGDEVHLRMVGTGFLRHMVRVVAGTLYEVGRSRRDPDWVANVLQSKSRAAAGATAPPEALLLEKIDYDERYRPT